MPLTQTAFVVVFDVLIVAYLAVHISARVSCSTVSPVYRDQLLPVPV